MANFWRLVNNVIEQADVLLEIVDSRLIQETRNVELERKIKDAEKPLILVLNKCDLTSKEYLEKKKKQFNKEDIPTLFVSSIEHLGTTLLRNKILSIAYKHKKKKEYLEKKEKIVVGVVGYPNTGKSSIINALKGKGSAKASSQSGFTKAIQLIKCDNKIYLLDTPGVIPFEEKDEIKHALIGATDANQVKDPDIAAMRLIEILDGKIEEYYHLHSYQPNDFPSTKNNGEKSDSYEILEAIAKKQNKIKKGSEPDVNTMAKIIIKDWQNGKIKI